MRNVFFRKTCPRTMRRFLNSCFLFMVRLDHFRTLLIFIFYFYFLQFQYYFVFSYSILSTLQYYMATAQGHILVNSHSLPMHSFCSWILADITTLFTVIWTSVCILLHRSLILCHVGFYFFHFSYNLLLFFFMCALPIWRFSKLWWLVSNINGLLRHEYSPIHPKCQTELDVVYSSPFQTVLYNYYIYYMP